MCVYAVSFLTDKNIDLDDIDSMTDVNYNSRYEMQEVDGEEVDDVRHQYQHHWELAYSNR